MQEISRTKKELAFAHKTIHNTKSKADTNTHSQNSFPDEIQNSMKLVETIGIQKKALEEENDELKSRISAMMDERSQYGSTSPIDQAAASAGMARQAIPALNLGNHGYDAQY